MEVKINQVVLHLLDPGASEPVLSDRAMDMDADLYEYYTATLERAFASDEVKNCRFLRIPLIVKSPAKLIASKIVIRSPLTDLVPGAFTSPKTDILKFIICTFTNGSFT